MGAPGPPAAGAVLGAWGLPAEIPDIWRWAAIHGIVLLCIALVAVISWRLNESVRREVQAALAWEGVIRSLLGQVTAKAQKAASPDAAMQVAVERTCALTGWPVGHGFWVTRWGTPRRSGEVWHLDDDERFARFREAVEGVPLRPGAGVGGRALATCGPVWATVVGRERDFPGRSEAVAAGLRTAFAVPVVVDDEVAGILEFFTPRQRAADPPLLDAMMQVGRQLALVAARTRSEERMRASEVRSRMILEAAGDALVTVDDGGTIVEWNRHAEAVFGWTQAEAVGRQLSDLIAPGPGAAPPGGAGLRALCRDGSTLPVELSTWEVRSEGGRRFTAVVRGLTPPSAPADSSRPAT